MSYPIDWFIQPSLYIEQSLAIFLGALVVESTIVGEPLKVVKSSDCQIQVHVVDGGVISRSMLDDVRTLILERLLRP